VTDTRISKLRAVAWDVDGTLVDSEPLHHAALLAGSRRWDVDLSDLPGEAFRGIHMGDVWTMLRPRLPESLAQAEWMAAITDHYIDNRRSLAPLPGALETIEALAARNIPQVCVSNSHRRIVEANLDALGIASHMRFLVAIDDVAAGKPDPEPYRRACAKLGLEPGAVLAVEDSATGALSAFRAGLPVAFCIAPPAPLTHPVIRVDALTRILDFFD
jgi:HAD superfamily hydrolase (TIGR01509 family)